MNYIFTVVLGYFIGCINGAQIIGKIKNVNIKQHGTKNAGASNVGAVMGFKYGLIVLAIDVLKAIIPILILKSYTTDILLVFLLSTFIIIGHIFPINMNFNGGKGTASIIGSLLAINWQMGLCCLTVLIVISLAFNYLVYGTLAFYITFDLYTIVNYQFAVIALSYVLTFIFLVKHKENFQRVRSNTESTISQILIKKRKTGI